MNFDSKRIKEYDVTLYVLNRMESYSYAPKKLELDLKNYPKPPAKHSIKEPPDLEMKELPRHLWNMFLGIKIPYRLLL